VATFRFAPSPNGLLHTGHAYSALIGHRMAREAGGRFLVRIEDIDVGRCREEYVTAIFEDLAWLGITWEKPVLRQSQNFAAYEAAADRLREMGVLYPCFATRAEIAAAAEPGRTDPDGAAIYPGLHKGLPRAEVMARMARGEKPAWRIDMERALAVLGEKGGGPLTFDELEPVTSACLDGMVQLPDPTGPSGQHEARPERWGDAVIVRKDVPASYHLAVVVDDAAQGVTHVTRGKDLLAATDIHRLLQELLGLPAPRYFHHELVTMDGRKLSKSTGDLALMAFRRRGEDGAAFRRSLGFEV
jgi:glutamyl-Q tRNA(Asp) synthetase